MVVSNGGLVDGCVIAKKDTDNYDGSNLPQDGKYDEKEGIFWEWFFMNLSGKGLDLRLWLHFVYVKECGDLISNIKLGFIMYWI